MCIVEDVDPTQNIKDQEKDAGEAKFKQKTTLTNGLYVKSA